MLTAREAKILELLAVNKNEVVLVLTDFSVCEIAHQVGFGDESNFSTRFTAMVGQSPQQYRKSAMKPAEN